MGSGRERLTGLRSRAAAGIATVVLAGALTACGATEPRENELRPPQPAEVSVNVLPGEVTVSPRAVAFRPEERVPILDGPEPELIPIEDGGPMPVDIAIANATRQPVRIAMVGPDRRLSPPITADGNLLLESELPTGRYDIRVVGAPDAGSGVLAVGPLRLSAQNVLALP